MGKIIYRHPKRMKDIKQKRYAVHYKSPELSTWTDHRFKWVALFFAGMRNEDFDVTVYDTKEEL